MPAFRATSSRGGVAVLTLLLVAGAALTVALTASVTTLAATRVDRDRHLSDRAFAAAESGAVDAIRRLNREPGLTSFADLSVGGIAVSRAVTTSGDSRVVSAAAAVSGVTATVRAECSVSGGTCVIRRY